ncbi:hypothetical protein BH09PSE6_BH09PSE6_00820 [soil metagenome]
MRRGVTGPHGARMSNDFIGWAASCLLFITLSWQIREQWRSRSDHGVSPWLFVGQVLSSALFIVYSVIGGNRVFVVSNTFILLLAIVGQLVYWRNTRRRSAD